MEASLGTDSIVLQRRRQLDVLVAKNYANSGRTRCSQSVPLIALALAIIGIIAINFHAAESILKGEIESMHRTILLPERHWRPSPVAFPNDNGSVTTKALLQEIDTKTDILLDRQKVTNETKFKYSPSLEVEKVYKTASTSPITAKSYGSSPESNIGSPTSSSSSCITRQVFTAIRRGTWIGAGRLRLPWNGNCSRSECRNSNQRVNISRSCFRTTARSARRWFNIFMPWRSAARSWRIRRGLISRYGPLRRSFCETRVGNRLGGGHHTGSLSPTHARSSQSGAISSLFAAPTALSRTTFTPKT